MRKTLISLTLIPTLLAGCASVAVSTDAIEQRTAFALGVERGSFVISNRQDDGLRTQYVATTKNGQRYNCYVTGTFSVTGRIVSDALCTKPGEVPKNPLLSR